MEEFLKDKKILKRVNYWVTIGIVLIICIGIFTWWNNSKKKTPHHKLKPQPALIDNTSTRPASYPTKEFKNLLISYYEGKDNEKIKDELDYPKYNNSCEIIP